MVHLGVMGEAVIQAPQGRVTPSATRVFSLALLLLLDREHPWERDELVSLIWPDASISNGRHNLRQALYRLRSVGVPVWASGERIVLDPAVTVRNDEPTLHESTEELSDAIVAGTRRIGHFLGGYDPTYSPALREWIEDRRSQSHARVRVVLARCLEHVRRSARWSEVERLATLLLQFDPLNEAGTLARAEVALLTGDKVGAVSMLERYADEVGRSRSELTLPARLLKKRVSESLLPIAKPQSARIPLIGRQDVIAPLMQAFTEITSEQEPYRAFSFLVHGLPGVGKTRILEEAQSIATLLGARVIDVSGPSTRDVLPLASALLLTRALLELPGALGCDPETLALLRSVSSSPGDETLAIPAAPHSRSALAPALTELLLSVSAEVPVAVFLDDVNTVSAQCSGLLSRALKECASARVCLIVAARELPTNESHWAEHSWSGIIRLDELSESDSRAFTRLVLSPRATSEQEDWVVSTGSGNPLYLRLLSDSVAMTGRMEVPQSLSAVIHSRLLLCSPITLRLLQTIALAEPYSDLETISIASGLAIQDLRMSIVEAEQLGLLRWQEGTLRLRHQMIVDVISEHFGDAAMALTHRGIALALEAKLRQSTTITLAWHCAHHWLKSGDSDMAVNATRKCTHVLTYAGFPDEAVDFACTVLESASSESARRQIVEYLLRTLNEAGRWKEIVRIGRRLQGNSSEVIGDQCALATVNAEFRLTGKVDDALARLRALAADVTRSVDTRIHAAEFGLIVADLNGAAEDGRILYSSIKPLLRHHSDQYASLACSVIYNTAYGELESALVDANSLVALGDDSGGIAKTSRSLRFRATVHERLGMPEAAREDLLHCLRLNESVRSRFIDTVTFLRLLQMSLDSGNERESKKYYDQLCLASSILDDSVTEAGCTVLRARYVLASGDASAALTILTGESQNDLRLQPLRHVAEYYAVFGLASLALSDRNGASTAADRLTACWKSLAPAGGFDFCAAALSVLRTSLDGRSRGSDTWTNYLRLRRERGNPGLGNSGLAERASR
jgi:DNA-binding SARP family transcriptional activator